MATQREFFEAVTRMEPAGSLPRASNVEAISLNPTWDVIYTTVYDQNRVYALRRNDGLFVTFLRWSNGISTGWVRKQISKFSNELGRAVSDLPTLGIEEREAYSGLRARVRDGEIHFRGRGAYLVEPYEPTVLYVPFMTGEPGWQDMARRDVPDEAEQMIRHYEETSRDAV